MKAVVLDRIALLLSFVGVFIAGVLSLGAALSAQIPCGASHGCDVVAMHPTSRMIANIPNAYFGFSLYLFLALLTAARMLGNMKPKTSIIIGYIASGLGTLASIVLTYISFAIIHAECNWCLASAATMVLLLITHATLLQNYSEDVDRTSSLNMPLLGGMALICVLALGWQYMGLKSGTAVKDMGNVDTAPDDLLVPKDVHVFGDPNAPITILEFADLMCPMCQTGYPIVRNYVMKSNGKVKYVFRQFPMYTLEGHANALPAALIAEVADEKGKFWDFVTAMYSTDHEQLKDINNIYAIADAMGLPKSSYENRIKTKTDPAFLRVLRDKQDGSKLGIQGTPAFFILAPGVERKLTTAEKLEEDLAAPEYKQFFSK